MDRTAIEMRIQDSGEQLEKEGDAAGFLGFCAEPGLLSFGLRFAHGGRAEIRLVARRSLCDIYSTHAPHLASLRIQRHIYCTEHPITFTPSVVLHFIVAS